MKHLKILKSCTIKGRSATTGAIVQNVDNATAATLIVAGSAEQIHIKKPSKTLDPRPASNQTVEAVQHLVADEAPGEPTE